MMRLTFYYLIALVMIIATITSCSPTTSLNNSKKSSYTGQLTEAGFNSLQQILTNTTTTPLKDTIIIKYDYNNETCWNLLDQKEDEYVMQLVTNQQQRMQVIKSARPHVSVFGFREPGNMINKLKKWDNTIIIDSTKQLFNLLFKEQSPCGNSIIVMPDKKFIFLRSDSHDEVLNLTKAQIGDLLRK